MSGTIAKSLAVAVLKTDELGVVFGWGCICTEKGEEYWDTQEDHIPEESMLRATTQFMEGDRVAKVMHQGEAVGKVVQSFPMTAEMAKLFLGMESPPKTGWMVGVKFDDPAVVAKFRSGEYTGFSLGGWYVDSEEVS